MLYVVPRYAAVFEVEYINSEGWFVVKTYDSENPNGDFFTNHIDLDDANNILIQRFEGWWIVD